MKLLRQMETDVLNLCRHKCLDWSFDFRCDLMRVSAVSLECVQEAALSVFFLECKLENGRLALTHLWPIFSPAWLLLGPLKLFSDVFVKLGKKKIKKNDARHRLM